MEPTRRPPPLTDHFANGKLVKNDTIQQEGKDGRAIAFENYNERILLTPPPQASPGNPLEQPTFSYSPVHEVTQSATSHPNLQAYAQNARHRGSLSSSATSAQDASQLLHGLHIRTDMAAPRRTGSAHSFESESLLRSSASASSLPRRVPSVRAYLHSTAGSLSPGSVISSPQIAAMLDMTPLPSPIMGSFETLQSLARTRSRGSSTSSKSDLPPAVYPHSTFSPTSPRRKGYPGLTQPHRKSLDQLTGQDSRERTRSLSEYVPGALSVPKPRSIAVSGTGPVVQTAQQSTLQREEYLSVSRGIVTPVQTTSPPLPALATVTAREDGIHEDEPAPKRQKREVFTARSSKTGQMRKYEALRELGQGTFSKVYLAVRQVHDRKDTVDYSKDSVDMEGVRARSRRLVAVKVVEHGPAGGADADRIEVSLKREVELMKAVLHPSIVHLKSFGKDELNRALLFMNYCPGGDLFEVASTKLEVLTPSLVRRIFSELVSAVRYLHQKYIVHRDIKLENVLLNIPIQVHADVPDWQSLDRAVITLTDLGLGRRIPEPPASPLLSTRCGSEDYAAPEILMGQPYDGRQTDAWALGVLLYSLMEGRLPFDPLPGARGDPATLRARTPHRIARCEWGWVRYGDEDTEWDPQKGKDLDGARICVESLLKRNTRRKALTEIREMPWVNEGILVDGGLRWVEEEAM